MSLPTQLMPGPGKDQEPETCSESVPTGRTSRPFFDRCGSDFAECDICGRSACPVCEDWPEDGDDNKTMCPECNVLMAWMKTFSLLVEAGEVNQ